MKDDSYTWGPRTECDIDFMSDAMARDRLGTFTAKGEVPAGAYNGDCCMDTSWRDESLAARGLERFQSHDDMGTRVEPMYEDQTVYKGYGDKYGR